MRLLGLLKKIFDTNGRELNRLSQTVEVINNWESDFQKLTDAELRAKTDEFRRRFVDGETLEDLLPEAFAAVREAAVRTLGQRHYDVQLMGAIVLHEGRIAEMKTGEGKTLAATAPAYLNALTGRGVHVVTVNDYLAKRDAEWMGAIYRLLGLEVGVILHDLDFDDRRKAYASDITYGTNNEFGFDYLRDNMVLNPEHMVQRELYYAIVDEVDSILIDEARTPLIISGSPQKSTELYARFARLVPQLKVEKDFTIDEKAKTVALTEQGIERVEKMLGVENLYDDQHFEMTHYLNQALKAQYLFKRDRDYIVKNGEVIIVDEFTGRLMYGRRYSDGLHQAIEAKERVPVRHETQTLASITFQNYFRMYDKLAGMTGTAKTEEEEFRKIYGMDVVVIPTNKPMIRQDHPDMVYKTEEGKLAAVVEEICRLHQEGRPVLVGTVSIEKSERLSEMLKKRGIPHNVLNAKYHEKEAEIIKDAGQEGAVTIATNMAGRGTDIVLGEGVAELGGLHIIGTERHEARRIDNQLRGRAGRQGDPGSSRFYVSLEDDLMRLFGSERINNLMERMGWDDNTPIESPMVASAIERAQKKVEGLHFEQRKAVLQYDDVLNKQREVVYEQRRQALLEDNVHARIVSMLHDVIDGLLTFYAVESEYPEEWDLEGLLQRFYELLGPAAIEELPADERLTVEKLRRCEREVLRSRLLAEAQNVYKRREEAIGSEQFRQLERVVLLRTVDAKWMEHLQNMDDLREGIGLRAYGQNDPLTEYRLEAFQLFEAMVQGIKEDVVRLMFRVRPVTAEVQAQEEENLRGAQTNRGDGQQDQPQPVRRGKKVGRNDPCPCGSGKKYKKCCGR